MQNIASLSEHDQTELLFAIRAAQEHGRTLRITTGTDSHGPFIQWAIGGGMWTYRRYSDWKE